MQLRFLAFPLFILCCQCASYTQNTQEMRLAFQRGSYEESLKKLEESGLQAESRNRLLYSLEKASILERLGKKDESRKLLNEADRIADELYTVSVTQTAASFLVNDAQQDYPGEDYEKILIHSKLALSFIETGNLEAAGIEARKVTTKLNQLASERGDGQNHYKADAFALFLAGLIFESRQEWDNAIIDYTKALALLDDNSYRAFYQGSVPSAVIAGLYRCALIRGRKDRLPPLKERYLATPGANKNLGEGNAVIVVIHELGRIAPKVAMEFALPIGKQIVRFSFPVIHQRRTPLPGEVGVRILGESFHRGFNIADYSAIAHYSLEDRRGRMLLKHGARLLAKGQLTEKAYREFGPLGGIAANVFSAVTETADTRSWSLAPGAFSVTRVDLPPGEYKLAIMQGTRTQDLEQLKLAAGEVKILRAY